jgi:hypothetical protein
MTTKRHKKYSGPRLKIGAQFIGHQVAMVPILRELSLTARRILDTLEIEHCRRGGRENGKLICTYDYLARFAGVSRSCIRAALRELVAAGLIEIVRPGCRSWADLRAPSQYRITYLPTFQGQWIEPTHEWKKRKAGPESTTGTGPKSDTGNGQLPDRNPTPREANYRAEIRHSLSRSLGEEGGGPSGGPSSLSVSPPAHHQQGAGSIPSPALSSDGLPSATAPSSGRLH